MKGKIFNIVDLFNKELEEYGKQIAIMAERHFFGKEKEHERA